MLELDFTTAQECVTSATARVGMRCFAWRCGEYADGATIKAAMSYVVVAVDPEAQTVTYRWSSYLRPRGSLVTVHDSQATDEDGLHIHPDDAPF